MVGEKLSQKEPPKNIESLLYYQIEYDNELNRTSINWLKVKKIMHQ